MTHPFPHLVARPGDLDLDTDLYDLTISHVVRTDTDLLITMNGGYGLFTAVDGTEILTSPDDPDGDQIGEFVICCTLGEFDPDAVDALCVVLDDWWARRAQVRFCSAHGRLSTLNEPGSHWVPLPVRGVPPAGVDEIRDV